MQNQNIFYNLMSDVDEITMLTTQEKIERIEKLVESNLKLVPLARQYPVFENELGVALDVIKRLLDYVYANNRE